MVMKLTSGSQHKLRQALWAPVYADVLEIVNSISTGHTLIPMGDDYHGKLNATTFTSRKFHASGIEQTVTPSEAFSAFDTPPTYVGPGRIPIITLNGSDEDIIAPDNALYTPDDAGGANGFSTSVWVRFLGYGGNFNRLQGKRQGDGAGSWEVYLSSSKFVLYVKDESAGAACWRTSNAVIPGLSNQWVNLTATYSGLGANAANGMLLYIDGLVVASGATNNSGGTYVGMEDLTTTFAIGSRDTGNFGDPVEYAGGPLGVWYATGVATAEQIYRLYQIGRAALIGA